jgi:hypothetical protein
MRTSADYKNLPAYADYPNYETPLGKELIMHFTIQHGSGVETSATGRRCEAERRQTLAGTQCVLLVVEGRQLSLTGTDLEVELVGRVTLDELAESEMLFQRVS